ncbi:hypothetical protein ACBP93_06595 [Paenalcaligenes hominis]|uniref:hypothetical protein n=1 Tax=Paenalcaligenes hominis TaxID=643674 RepID=UPI003526C13D
MTQESRLVIRVDSKLSEQQVKDLDKALMLMERTGLSVYRTTKTTSHEIGALGRESEAAARSVDRATAVWSRFNSVLALAGVSMSAVAAINMYKSVAENVESLRLFSEQIGITTEQLSSLRYAADDMAGVSSRTLDPALRRMTRRIQEAANESGPAANALKMLRLEAKALSELDVESQLYAVADAMKALPNHADKLRATMAIFDTEGMPLVNMLNQGAEAIRAAQIEAEQLNQTISQVDADRVGRLNSEFSKLGARLEGIKTQSMLGFLPVVEDLSAGLGVLADNFDTIATITGGAALVALSRYTGGLLEAQAQTVKSVVGKRNAARAELELAQAQQRQTAETLRQTLALNTQNVTRKQTQAAINADIAARARLTAAEAAMTRQMTASTAAMGLARGALGLVGGPFGALTLAVTAGAAAWYEHEVQVRENRRVLEDMQVPIEELKEKLEDLNRTQALGLKVDYLEAYKQAVKDTETSFHQLVASVSGLNLLRFDVSRKELGEFIARLKDAKDQGEDLAPILEELQDKAGVPFEAVSDWYKLNERFAENTGSANLARDSLAALDGVLDSLSDSAHGAAGGISDLNTELSEAAIEGQKYLERLADQALTAGIDTHVGRLKKLVEAGKLEYSDEDFKKALQYAQHMDSVASAGKKTTSSVKQLSNEIDNLIGSLYPAIQAEKEWVKSQKLLDQALKQGKITQEQHTKGLMKLQEAYELIAFAVPDHVKAIQDEAKSLKASIPSLRDRVRHFGLSASVIARHAEVETRSSLATAQATLAIEKAKGASEERVKQVEQEIKALEELAKYQAEATGYISEYESLERERRYFQEVSDEAKRTHEEIERSLTDALLRGFESGKGFGKNFIDTLKNMFGSLVLRPIIQPIAAGAAGMLGFGGIANASTGLGGGGLGGFNLLTGFAGSSAGLVQSVGGSLASINGSLGDFGANLVMNADKIGGALDMAGAGIAYGASLYQMTQGKWGAGLGGAAGQFLGGPIGSFIGSQLGGMLDKAFKGETRSGGGFVYDPNSRQAMYHSGPSGGYGGQQTLSAVESLFSSAADTIVHVFEGAGVDAGLAFFHGAFESSSKGRGGTFSGGDIVLADGSVIGFGGAKKGQGFGGTSGSTEEMFANLQAEMHFSVLEAWKTVGSQMPQVIHDMLSSIDIRSLSAEQAQAAVIDISALTGQVTTLTAALNTLPIENLKNLSFDLAYGLSQASGGMEALAANSASFYQGFYSEAERQEHLHRQLVDTLAAVNMQLPPTREGFRRLIDSLGTVTSANQEAVAALLGAASAADQYYSQLEQAQERAHQEQLRRQQEAYQEARSHTDRLMSAFRELAQQQIRELQQASSLTDKVASALQKSLNTQISSLTSITSLLSSMVSELRGSVGLFEMQAAEGWRVIGNTLSTGVIPDADTLRGAIGSVRADFNDQFYESAFERQRDQLVLANQLESINALAKPQLSIAEMQLQVMQDQLAELREGTKRAFELAGLSQVQIAAIKSVDDKTATGVGLTKDQLEALRTGNSASAVLQNLTREQIQGILGVKSETSSLYGLSQSQIEAMREVDLNTQTVAELTKRLQTAMEAEGLANRQIDTIQSQLKTMQSQYDQLRGLNVTMTSLDQGMRLLAVAMKAEQAAKPPTTGSGTGSGALQFGDQAYKFKNQAEARNYIMSNTGLLGGFASEVSSGWTTASNYLKYAQDHYSRFGWSEGRSSSGPRNLGRTHRPGTYSEAQSYLVNNNDLLDYYLDLVSSDKSFAGDRGMLAYAQQHYDAYGKSELRKYARGGDHPGGLRLVGELGPELEMTGPSRIMSANRTQSLLNQSLKGPDLTGFIHSLIRETQELRRMYENLMRSMIAMQQRTARVLERWEGDEYPVRVEEMPFEPVVVKVKKEVA